MSKADEMFEKLGYYQKEYTETIFYIKDNELEEQVIEFCKTSKIVFSYTNKDEYYVMGINMQELQAINQKVKELGWNEQRINRFYK